MTVEVSGKFFQTRTPGKQGCCGDAATCWSHVLPTLLLAGEEEYISEMSSHGFHLHCFCTFHPGTVKTPSEATERAAQASCRGPSKPDMVLLTAHMLASSPAPFCINSLGWGGLTTGGWPLLLRAVTDLLREPTQRLKWAERRMKTHMSSWLWFHSFHTHSP